MIAWRCASALPGGDTSRIESPPASGRAPSWPDPPGRISRRQARSGCRQWTGRRNTPAAVADAGIKPTAPMHPPWPPIVRVGTLTCAYSSMRQDGESITCGRSGGWGAMQPAIYNGRGSADKQLDGSTVVSAPCATAAVDPRAPSGIPLAGEGVGGSSHSPGCSVRDSARWVLHRFGPVHCRCRSNRGSRPVARPGEWGRTLRNGSSARVVGGRCRAAEGSGPGGQAGTHPGLTMACYNRWP